jgi:two-component system sensor histidine kinase HydH
MYLPALSIVAGIAFLLALIGVSTYRNLDRQKAAALGALGQQGKALIQALEAGARTGMMMPMWSEDAVDTLVKEISRNEAIGYVYIIEPDGKIAHRGGAVKPAGIEYPFTPPESTSQILDTIRSQPDGSTYYELAKLFNPYSPPPGAGHSPHMMGPGRDASGHHHVGDMVVIGFKMTAYSEARRADIQHAFMMAGVLLLLGTGVLFFIIVIQNFYLVDKTLKQTKDYTRQVLANMANGLIGIDTAGRVTSYNQKALELLGLNDAGFRENHLSALIDFKACGIEATLEQCQVHLEKEFQHRKASGEHVALALSSTPILDESGSCQGAVLLLRDLTEIKRLETQLRRAERLAAVGRLAAGVAHEIRNPLSSIRGFAQFLQRSLNGQPREQDYAATMVAEVDRIDRVVSGLLSLARPVETKPAACSIPDLVHHVIRLVAGDARSRDISLDIDVAAGVGPARVDPNQITQALLNLVLNALHAVAPGGVVTIGAAIEESGGLRLWVSDNGCGIPTELLDKVFDPFFTTSSRGTGLGLAMVQQIVEGHRGEITVESPLTEDRRGCRFTIRIPDAAVGGRQVG